MSRGQHILLVEDDRPLAEALSLSLLTAGYTVAVAADGLAALKAFDEHPPALILLDLNVPVVSGFRLLQIFKRDRPTLPILVMTALSFEEAQDAVRSGADDFISKPFDPPTLRAKVSYYLGKGRPVPSQPTTTLSQPSIDDSSH
ncbi:MAG TPA: response regulator [Chloroflexota bacterium]|nr:response regulator [Chloroflexota bacterium]